MSRASLEREMPAGAELVLDTSAILAYLAGSEITSQPATVIVDELIRPGRNPALVSAVSVTEALVRAFRAGGSGAVGTIDAFLGHFPNLRVVPVDYEVAREAARVRAVTGLRTPDALIVATGLVSGAAIVVGNDERWRPAIEKLGNPLAVLLLAGHVQE